MSRKPYKKTWNKKSNTKSDTEIYKYEVNQCHGYFGYQLYFKDPDKDAAKILKCTQSFEKYIEANISQFHIIKIKENLVFTVDLKSLLSDRQIKSDWPEFSTEIIHETEFCLSCMGLAMHSQVLKKYIEDYVNPDVSICTLPEIHCRLLNHEPVLQLKNLRVNTFGELVSIRGTVIKASTASKIICDYMAFSCNYCTGTQVVKQIDGVYTLPAKCLSKGCRSYSNFVPLLASPNTKTIHSQLIKLQELIDEGQRENGRVPRTIECEFTEDLVSCCIPGDDVIITGVVKVRSTTETNNKNKQPSIFFLYVDVNSVINEKTGNQQSKSSHSRITFNKTDYQAIQKIYSEPSLFRFLVQSLCPNIYGQEMVKAGLILALFGGTSTSKDIRADSHVLMVGDPGLGKSQLLQACSNVAPRGVYVCGNTSTTSGLTVTMTRESSSDYALEAGALVLADQGCCCIDEFDKMSSQHNCLLEVMEQQSISIAKAGVTCTLPTRATILAAANPAGGHYNKAKTVSENLKMGSPLLSRFDLVFILLDQPNEHLDMLLSEHVLALHVGRKRHSSSQSTSSVSSSIPTNDVNLKNRLKLQQGESLENLPHVLFRKYIAYAQKYVHPKLNKEAQKVLKQFYIDLRKKYHKDDCTPVTTRQLQSLLRLTQARAKLELREEATAEDAIDVLEIMRHSLVDIFSDGYGLLDFSRSQNGSGVNNKKNVKKFLQALRHKSEVLTTSEFSLKEIKELAEQIGVPGNKVTDFLDFINFQGYLLKRGGDKYRLSVT